MNAETGASNSTVVRVIAVLRLLCDDPEGGLSVRRAGDVIGISHSAVHRILVKMSEQGLARALPDRRYAAGPIAYEWASRLMSRSSLLHCAKQVMKPLVERFNETVYFAQYVPAERRVVFVHVVECQNPIKYVLPVGHPAPLHAGSAGKAVLAWLPDDTLDQLELTRFTNETITDRSRLHRELVRIRECGYATSHGERTEGVIGVASAVLVADDPIGALSITIPRSRLDGRQLPLMGKHVASAAQVLTGLLAGLPPVAHIRDGG